MNQFYMKAKSTYKKLFKIYFERTELKVQQFKWEPQQTHHVDSTLKQHGNDRFHVFSTWNPRGVFVTHAYIEGLMRINEI